MREKSEETASTFTGNMQHLGSGIPFLIQSQHRLNHFTATGPHTYYIYTSAKSFRHIFDPMSSFMGKTPAQDAIGKLNCISKSLFSGAKKDSPKKYSKNSPTSVTAKNVGRGTPELINYDSLPPESLFKLLKDLKWRLAASRAIQMQDETRQWVVKYDEKRTKMLWKRLPIHEACIRLPSTEVISKLLDCYPEGASAKDNQHRTPLHHAVIHGAHIDIIYLLLNVAYEATQEKDFFNKIPQDYAYTTTFAHKTDRKSTRLNSSHRT